MTAPRACRSCGAPLPGEVRWCLQCFAPVVELTPRPKPLPPLERVEEPPPSVARSPLRGDHHVTTYSRWRGGPTSFRPVGRIVLTLAVLAWFPWTAVSQMTFGDPMDAVTLAYLLGEGALAAVVLRHVWKPEAVVVDAGRVAPSRSVRSRLNAHAGALGRSIDARLSVVVVAVLAAVALAFAWSQARAGGRYAIVAVIVIAAVGSAIAWWNEL